MSFGETDTYLNEGKENGRWLCIHGHYTAVP